MFRVPLVLLLLAAIVPVTWSQDTTVWENAKPGVKYIGTEKCVNCHQEQHGTYLQTTHSIATVKTDPSQEPSPTDFQHPTSEARYEIDLRDKVMFHREIRFDGDGNEIATTEEPILYTVGSGTHGKSYLYRTGEFFGQSPMSWFEESGGWGMSPGYDRPDHSSFHRKVASGCIYCHVGSIDRKQGNPYQFEIVETTIGCERCHGPGELHAKKYRDNPDATGVDDTIVNPDNLPRHLAEAICQQCHLQGVGEVATTGHDFWDFRPGLPLTDFRVDYQFSKHDRMMIVGHVEQLHASECYIQDESLTCATCHDPHDPVAPQDRVDFFRSTCLDCHKNESCGKPLDERNQLADNSCYQCHMPKADTNVVHAAFHHHRIGIHTDDEGDSEEVVTELVPLLDISQLSKDEQIRCEAVTKVILLRDDPDKPEYKEYAMDATKALIGLKQKGFADALTDSQLAWLANSQGQKQIAESLAVEAIQKEPRPTLAHIQATSLLAQIAFQKGDKPNAVALYRKVARYHRDARDTFFLGLCENNAGNVEAAIAALKLSLEIDPAQFGPHSALQAIYQATKQPEKAALHADAVEKINALTQKLQSK